MKLEPQLPDFAKDAIIHFIRDFVKERNVVIGLSGGVDSSVVLALSVRALGSERVLAVHMPDSITPKTESEDAKLIANKFGVSLRIVPIDNAVKEISKVSGVKKTETVGNLKARVRMSILYAIANEESRLVVGTSNKSEILTGYFTKYGDGASDLAPIGDLYKTQVRILAKELEIPQRIIDKKPSANLMAGQYDEDELGISYENLDKILMGIELGLNTKKIKELANVSERDILRVLNLYRGSRHKRVMLYIPKIGARTVNTDWRE